MNPDSCYVMHGMVYGLTAVRLSIWSLASNDVIHQLLLCTNFHFLNEYIVSKQYALFEDTMAIAQW